MSILCSAKDNFCSETFPVC